MKRIFWMLQAAVFYCLTLVAARIPAAVTGRCGSVVGRLLSRLIPKRRAIAIDNMSQALPYMKAHPLWAPPFGNIEQLSQAAFENLGRSLIEVCRLYHSHGDDVISNIEVRGRENYEAAIGKGKGVLCLSGHCGNWELLALALSHILGDGVVVANRQKNPLFNQMVERMRMRYRSRVIYKKGALRGILAALRKGGSVGILGDQAVLPAEGVLIEVMGRKAWASKAPVLIAQKSGAPLVPVFIHREGERHVITFYPEHRLSGDMSDEGIRNDTQSLSRYLEDFVVAHPTQWYWVHRRWKRAGEAATPAETVLATPAGEPCTS